MAAQDSAPPVSGETRLERRNREREARPSLVPFAFMAAFAGVLAVKALLLRGLVFGADKALAGVWWELGVIVALLAFAGLAVPRGRAWAFVAVDVVLSVSMMATAVYASFYRDIGTVTSLGAAGEAGGILDSVANLIHPVHAWFFVDIAVAAIVFSVWSALRRRADGWDPRFVIVAAVGVALVALPVSRILGTTESIDAMASARRHGILSYQTASVVRDPQERAAVAVASAQATDTAATQPVESSGPMPGGAVSPLQAEMNALRGPEGERFVEFAPGSAKGKNLLIIQAEAIQTMVVGAKVDGVEVMPNLNKLVSESYYFPHTVVNVGKGTTIDAEFLVNTSIYPPGNRPTSYVYSNYALPGLPRLMSAAGYRTATFHADRLSFWRRGAFYPALGWDKVYARDFYGENDIVGMGPSDDVLFAKTLPELQKMDAADKPFYAMIVTLSAHYPFAQLPASKKPMALTAVYKGTILGGYLQRQHHADAALGEFIAGLKKKGLWDNTVVVIYGDHLGLAGLPKAKDAPAFEALLGRPYSNADMMQVPLIVHMPGQTNGQVVADTAGQIDVMPTVADPLGIDLSQTPHFGRDLWGHGEPFVLTRLWMPNGTAATNQGLFVPDEGGATGRWYSLESGLPVSGTEPAKPIADRITAIADLSNAYIKSLAKRPK